ncbi:MAG TPA: 4a-hydroxytetrahydrobiopterin dehydratase [Patescibacteria group bacterium]|nr:4a-hydroxytetrahydrobiopterin dehydratase [Patescibacteria group bacterium]
MSTTLASLSAQRCKPRKGAEHALSRGEAETRLALLPDWALSDDGHYISKDFRFRDFHRTMTFVNALAWIAHVEDHHPDMEVGFGHCLVRFNTHDVGGLSENDFICAAKIEMLHVDHLP